MPKNSTDILFVNLSNSQDLLRECRNGLVSASVEALNKISSDKAGGLQHGLLVQACNANKDSVNAVLAAEGHPTVVIVNIMDLNAAAITETADALYKAMNGNDFILVAVSGDEQDLAARKKDLRQEGFSQFISLTDKAQLQKLNDVALDKVCKGPRSIKMAKTQEHIGVAHKAVPKDFTLREQAAKVRPVAQAATEAPLYDYEAAAGIVVEALNPAAGVNAPSIYRAAAEDESAYDQSLSVTGVDLDKLLRRDLETEGESRKTRAGDLQKQNDQASEADRKIRDQNYKNRQFRDSNGGGNGGPKP